MTELSNAMSFAVKAHEGHKRSGGVPYHTHLARVAHLTTIAATQLGMPEREIDVLASAAWLHDTVEDVGILYDDLELAGVSFRVVDIVQALTKTEAEEADQENGSTSSVQRVVKAGSYAILVKLADRLDNLRDGHETFGVSYVSRPSRLASTQLLLDGAEAAGIKDISLIHELKTWIAVGVSAKPVKETS